MIRVILILIVLVILIKIQYILNIIVSHLVRRGSWICPRMRRAIAIVAISPRRISYITITLLYIECKKADVHATKFYASAASG